MYVLRLNVVYRRFCPFLIRKIVLVENFGKKMITNQHKTRHFVLVCDQFIRRPSAVAIRRRDARSDHKPTQNTAFCVGL